MIKRVLNAPINLYFDVTPIGRILNKFSKDLQSVEEDLCWSISGTVACFYMTICALVISVSATPWLLIIIPVIAYLLYKLYRYAIFSMRETSRVEIITRSPMLS
jgi:ATP-binding cassette subfamily C (CFTR/MRP) protein 1